MKFITFILSFFLSLSLHAQGQYAIEIQSGGTCRQIETELVDSITFVKAGNVYIQKTWCGNTAIDNIIEPYNTSIKIQESQNEYRILEYGIDGKDAIVSQSGDFCSIVNTNSPNKNICAVFGNKIDGISDYVIMDSLGLIRSMVVNDSTYNFYYGKDSLIVGYNSNWLCNISYEKLVSEKTRASIWTRNPIYRLLSAISQIRSFCNKPLSYTLSRLLYLQMKGNRTDRIYDFTNDIVDGIDLLKLIELLDKLEELEYFGDASIETLPPKKLAMCNYDLSCKFTKSSLKTFWMKYLQDNDAVSYKITMRLANDKILGETLTKTQTININESGVCSFNFPNLDIGTYYNYEPDLEIDYNNIVPDEIYMSIFGEKVNANVHVHKYGSIEHFAIGNIGCSVGEPQNVTDKSADLECTYSNIPEGAVCGVKVVNTTTKEEMKISNGTTEGTRIANVAGLKPNTDYAYTGYVTYKGVDYPSWNGGGFTTLPPDISGTWTCKETHYRFSNINFPYYTTYTVTLNKDGSVSCSDTSGIISSSWTFKSNGEVEFEFMDLATQTANSGKKWKGNIDDMNNPRKITGYTNRWNYNQNGFFNGDAVEFEMTR